LISNKNKPSRPIFGETHCHIVAQASPYRPCPFPQFIKSRVSCQISFIVHYVDIPQICQTGYEADAEKLGDGIDFNFTFPRSENGPGRQLADYHIDRERIYVTGLNMGGEATYRFALHRPRTFAAIAPLAAYLNSPQSIESIKNLPIWAIHGTDDTVVPLSMAQRPMKALKQVEGNVQFTILEQHDHDVWTDTYAAPQFYDWLLQHKRP
jgi:pimeloyl-ACP methyl ester carboxylesterase